MTRRGVGAAVALLPVALLLASAAPARAAYPQDPPNDPSYAPAEQPPSTTTCAQQSVNDEQHYLYSFRPQCTPNASDIPSGMSIDQVWAHYTTGSPETVIAYIEGGINLHGGDAAELADKMYLNWRELPVPCTGTPCTVRYGTSISDYDVNGDGAFTPSDYAHDPRVSDANHNDLLDGEDVIVAFSCFDAATLTIQCGNGVENVDNDGDGYPHDISGWDFYDNQNDPATVDSTYGHANSQMRQEAAQTDNGIDGAGICPRCLIMPIKAGAEALDQTDKLAQAWIFAADAGASVITSVTADLGYSDFMRQAVEYANSKGLVMVESSNDFDSTDHQGGMFWPHVIPGNGLVTNTQGMPSSPLTAGAVNQATTSFLERADETSWGTHNMFSVSTDGGSTSESTPTVAGLMGLVLSYGRTLNPPLTGPEAVQVVRATSMAITDPNLDWPGSPGEWNLQYGYGRPDALTAVQAIQGGNIPPLGSIASPDWYSLYDPTTTPSVPVTGSVSAPRSSGYTWTLQYAPGAQPNDSQFLTAGSGAGSAPFSGSLGTVDLSRLRQSFWTAPFGVSQTKELETTEQYTVTLRLRVTDASGRVGEDRRTIMVHHDPSLLPGFPMKLGHGGEGQAQLVDLQGTGRLDLVFGDTDGLVHAVDPASGAELPGWPVSTDATVVTHPHPGIDPGHEPLFSPVAVGDLDHDGNQWVVATSGTGKTYVFDAYGNRRAGWPRVMNRGVTPPPIPRPALPHTRLPQQGATAPPVLVDLQGDGRLDVVQSGWDGWLHAWDPNGNDAPGWPVHVTSPPTVTMGHTRVNDEKIDTAPVVANWDPNGRPVLVVKSQYTDITGDGIQPNGVAWLHAFHADGTPVSGFPAPLPGIIEYYGSAQEFITEGAEQPVVGPVGVGGADAVAASPVFSPTEIVDSAGNRIGVYGPVPDATAGLLTGAAQISPTNLPTDAPISFTTAGAFGRVDGTLLYAQPGSGGATTAASLLLNGSGVGLKNYMRAYVAAAGPLGLPVGAPPPGFPSLQQGLAFLSQPIITDVAGDGAREIVGTADSSALQAYTLTGAESTGFPKFNTGWELWAPSAGDLLSDGHVDIVALNREGYVFAWRTPGQASANTEWWTYGHDEHHTSRYGTDTRPPGVIRDALWQPGMATATFTAPGDDWYSGTASHYAVRFASGNGIASTVDVPVAGPAGTRESLPVPPGTTSLTVQAVDAAGNLGMAVTMSARAPSGATLHPSSTGRATLAALPDTATAPTAGAAAGAPVAAVALCAFEVAARRRRRASRRLRTS